MKTATGFRDKVIWITGASSGIGEALAVRFARDGAKLVLSARREAELQRVARRCIDTGLPAASILVLPLDVTQTDTLPAKVDEVLRYHDHIDLLINNAGITQRSLCQDTQLSVYRQLFDVDVIGQIALTQAVLPFMLARRSGHIAVTASVAGKVGVRMRTGYCAAKHAVMGFFDALRAEVEDEGVQVSTIVPGFIDTPIAQSALAGDGSHYGQSDPDNAGGMDVVKCADIIVRQLARSKREIPVGGRPEMAALWAKRIAPELLFRIMKKRK